MPEIILLGGYGGLGDCPPVAQASLPAATVAHVSLPAATVAQASLPADPTTAGRDACATGIRISTIRKENGAFTPFGSPASHSQRECHSTPSYLLRAF